MRHGSTNGYNKGCRCTECKAAHTLAARKYAARHPRQLNQKTLDQRSRASDLADQIWLPIPGWPFYEVSDLGNVRSLDRTVICSDDVTMTVKGMVLSPSIRRGRMGEGKPYRTVWLSPGNKRWSVGALVLMAYVGPRPDGQVMRHLDDDSLNDRLSNLSWGTSSENSYDSYRNGRVRLSGERNGNARLTEVDVAAIRSEVSSGTAQRVLAQRYGMAVTTISAIVRRRTWK